MSCERNRDANTMRLLQLNGVYPEEGGDGGAWSSSGHTGTANGYAAFDGSGNATAVLARVDVPFACGDASPKPLISAPAGKVIHDVRVAVTTAFDGAGAALTVGSAGDPDELMTAAQNLPSEAGAYEVSPGVSYGSTTAINLSITPGSGATQGAGVVTIIFQN